MPKRVDLPPISDLTLASGIASVRTRMLNRWMDKQELQAIPVSRSHTAGGECRGHVLNGDAKTRIASETDRE